MSDELRGFRVAYYAARRQPYPLASMPRNEGRSVETVVVGTGQAGLVMSRLLSEAGREHVLLDRRSSLGGGWQDRWDGFQLVGPNWTVSVPGLDYQGDDPDGYMHRDELIGHWRRYAEVIAAPIELDTEVQRLEGLEGAGRARFRLTTSRGTVDARDVIVAGGPFQRPNVPALAASLAPSILSLHSHDYRSPADLPPGRVLLVGSGQSGIQLTEELVDAGREVILSVGRCGPVPRRYRGRDAFWWLRQLRTRGREAGVTLPTAADLPSPGARFACNPQLTGHGGGHDVNLRLMSEAGLRLAGRLTALDGTVARFASDLGESLRFADGAFAARLQPRIEGFIERIGELFPEHEAATSTYEPPELTELDLRAEGVTAILWTSGYRPAFDWIRLPVLDELGLPIQQDGATTVDGLTFIGTPWLVDMGSANLVGLVSDAESIAARW